MSLSEETQHDLDQSLAWAVQNDTLAIAKDLLEKGANPDAISDTIGDPIIWTVQVSSNSNQTVQMLNLLLDYGANPFVMRESDGQTLLHMAAHAGAEGMIFQLFDAGFDAEVKNRDGQTPEHFVKAHGGALPVTFDEEKNRPIVAIDETLTKRDLLAHEGGTGRTPLSNPRMLHRFNEIVAQLEANGEPPLTKEDLLKPVQKSTSVVSHLSKASHCRVIGELIDYLDVRGEALTAEELSANPYPIAQAMRQRSQLGLIFDAKRWDGKSPDELTGFVDALPSDVQGALKNYHQLRHHLQRQEASEVRIR